MSDLDKLFKKKLEQRSFEFKDAYWQGAEQLIEADEGKRRRRLGWWWTLGVMFLLGLASSIFYYSQVDQAQIVNTEDLAQTERTKEEALPLQLDDNKTAKYTAALKGATNTKEEKVQKQNSESGTSKTITTNQDERIKSGSEYVSETRRSDSIGASTRESNIKNHSSEKPDVFIDNTSNFISPADGKAVISESDTQKEVSEQSYEKSIPKIDTPAPVSESKEFAPIVNLELLETRGLEQLENETESAKMDMIVKRFVSKPWSLGVNLSTMYNFSDIHTGYTGLALGTSINYKINQRWSLQSGLGYSIRKPENIAVTKGSFSPNNFGNAVFEDNGGGFVTTTNYYNFGLIQVNEIVNINQFHFIELPVNLQYQFKRHSLSLGWQLNYLSGIYGEQYLQTSEAMISPATNVPGVTDLLVPGSISKGWLDRSLYNKWSSELSMNYGFLLNPRWRINLGAHYQLFENGLVNTENIESDLSSRSGSMVNSNRLYFRLGMQYTIGK
jgi:hypothetical protein